MAENRFYLGLDLSPEYTQLSYYKLDTGEPESIYHSDSKDTYLLPNIMFYSDKYEDKAGALDDDGWSVGTTASAKRFKENGVVVDRVYQKVMMNESIKVYDKEYKAKELLTKLMLLHIREFTGRYEEFVIEKLVVTIADADALIIKAVEELGKALKLSGDSFEIVSHVDSGLYYIFNQPEPLRHNSVALFDFSGSGLDYYRIDLTRHKTPDIAEVIHVSYRDKLNMSAFKKDKEELDEEFAEICKEVLSDVYISSVFLTGIGFADNWLKDSAAVLCQGRRVFVGQNIYTKGACYRAFGQKHSEPLERYFIQSEYTVKADIGINTRDEQDTFVPISRAGQEWFNTKGKLYIFPDETNRVELIYRHAITGAIEREFIEIHGLPKRPPKTTKLSLEVEFYDAARGAVVIRDEGFGTLYPTTNKIYRKEFDLKWEK
jgi:hypothetical protein